MIATCKRSSGVVDVERLSGRLRRPPRRIRPKPRMAMERSSALSPIAIRGFTPLPLFGGSSGGARCVQCGSERRRGAGAVAAEGNEDVALTHLRRGDVHAREILAHP